MMLKSNYSLRGPKLSLLMVSNFLSSSIGTKGVCDDLSAQLASHGWPVLTASSQVNRVRRLLDMLSISWSHRHQYQIAIVDVFSGPAFFWAEMVCLLLRRMDKPYILTLHGGDLPSFAKRWSRRVRRQLRMADVVTVPSRYLLEKMQPYRSDLKLLANPVDVGAFDYRLRESVRPRLVWVRKFHRLYNPSLAPRALALLRNEFPDIELTMSGPDKGDGSLAETKRVTAELGISSHLTFRGAVPAAKISAELGQGDIFLNTTNFDNTPVSILEAMACGLCIVSTNVGGIPFLLENEWDSLLVSPDDPAAMAKAIRRILTEPSLSRRLSFNARRKVEAFDWSNVLPQWEQLLTTLHCTRCSGTRATSKMKTQTETYLG